MEDPEEEGGDPYLSEQKQKLTAIFATTSYTICMFTYLIQSDAHSTHQHLSHTDAKV